MTGFLQAWSVRWQAPASSARAGAGAASGDGTGRPALAAADRLSTDHPPVGRILPLTGLLVLGLGFQQVGDRTAKRRADPVQIIQPHRDRLLAPQRGDLAQRRREADLLEGLQQVAGPPDVPLGRDPAQVPLHPKLPLSTASRCGNRSVTGPRRYRAPAVLNARRKVDSVTARSGVGTFNAATAPGSRSDGHSGAPGSSGSSPNSPRISSTYHHSSSRPSANRYASRCRGPDPPAPLPSTRKRPHWPDSQCTSPIRTAHSSAARTPEM